MTTAQGLTQDAQLRYSRANEAEADRVGLRTLYNAGMDPYAAPQMFERMYAATRYSQTDRVPEFLRTHPLSEKRIADTRPRHAVRDASDLSASTISSCALASRFRPCGRRRKQWRCSARAGGRIHLRCSHHYGLVLALTAAGRADEAAWRWTVSGPTTAIGSNTLSPAPKLIWRVATLRGLSAPRAALDTIAGKSPADDVLCQRAAAAGSPHLAEAVLLEQSRLVTTDPGLWYLLAEVQGLAGNIVGLHRFARGILHPGECARFSGATALLCAELCRKRLRYLVAD